ncbi:MAG: aminotransferase class V-fold PLP-dependent enzyme, partial [Myxococcota bacterium]
LGVDLLSLSAHKLYGPQGVGALYVRRTHPGRSLRAELDGGGHERGMRSGTLNVPGIVGLGAACAVAREALEATEPRIRSLRRRLADRLSASIGDLVCFGADEPHRVPGILCLAIPGIGSDALVTALPEVALSAGSACTSGSTAPSHVLAAMGVPMPLMHGAVRTSLGRSTTEAEIDLVAERIVRVVHRLR